MTDGGVIELERGYPQESVNGLWAEVTGSPGMGVRSAGIRPSGSTRPARSIEALPSRGKTARRRGIEEWSRERLAPSRQDSASASKDPVSNLRPPLCGADHSRKNGRSINEDEPRMNTNRHEDRWTSFNHKRRKILLQFGSLGVTMSWDDGFPGARASRPHNDASWERGRPARTMTASRERGRPARTKLGTGLGHLPHLDQPGTAPWLSFGLADGVPAHRVAACSIALKLSGGQRDRMRAGRPRSQAPGRGGSYESETRVLKKGARWPEAGERRGKPQAEKRPDFTCRVPPRIIRRE